ncbi:hypothetical protein BU16DRAFT_526983 [Lophium mytilinum]|uniref:Uncharacterized protein n=1 Tax=Lophium mytilinum TaxID=390894 RepID=A0A6A6QVY3_9PEZI|nr:hypothetical protein BU16DRAFT_526983 [Lophium mytilinum]
MRGSLGDALPWQKAVSYGFPLSETITLRERDRTSDNASIDSDAAFPAETVHINAVEPGSTLRLLPDHAHYNIQVSFLSFPGTEDPQSTWIELDEVCSRLWKLASEALQKYPDPPDQISLRSTTYCIDPWSLHHMRYRLFSSFSEYPLVAVKRRLKSGLFESFPFDEALPYTDMLAFILAGFVYGGLYLLAWTAPFASHTQRILWRMSSAAIFGAGPALLAVLGALFGMNKFPKVSDHDWVIIILFWLLVPPLYLFSRTYLVVECFLNIARLPEEVYRQPSWSQYVPHIS